MPPLTIPSNPPPSERANVTIVCGPAHSGKTRWAIDRAIEDESAIIVTPTVRGAERVNQMLTPLSTGVSVVTATTISAVVEEVLRFGPAQTQPPTVLSDRLQRLLIGDLLAQHAASCGGTFQVSPGLLRTVQRCLNECRLAGASANKLQRCAAAASIRLPDSTFQNRMGMFLPVLRLYEAFCSQNNLVDEADQLRLAAERLRSGGVGSPYNTKAIVFDGFHRLSLLQRELISALASVDTAPEISITIDFDATRPLLFQSAARTIESLRVEFNLREAVLPPSAATGTSGHLSRILYDAPGKESSCASRSHIPETAAPAEDIRQPIRILCAPNRDIEADMAARELIGIHHAARCRWSDLAIVARGGDYPASIAAVFERFGIPLASTLSRRLSHNPLIQMLLSVLDLLRFGWRREHLSLCLTSSYSGVNRAEAGAFNTAAAMIGFEGGKSEWIANAARLSGDASIEEFLGRLAAIEEGLSAEGLPIGVRCTRLLELPKALHLAEAACRAGQDTIRSTIDERALQEASAALNDLTRLAKLREHGSIGFGAFCDRVSAVFSESGFVEPGSADAVQLIPPMIAGEKSLAAMIVMGLNEAEFPRRIMDDPLIRDEERLALAETGIKLSLSIERADDERWLFYRTVTAPTDQLILSYARADSRRDLAPSFFLDDLAVACAGTIPVQRVVSTLADIIPSRSTAANDNERILSAVSRIFDPPVSPNSTDPVSFKEAATLLELAASASPATVRAVINSRRLPASPVLPEDTGGLVRDAQRPLSVHELKTYLDCPFRFLMEARLGLPLDRDVQYANLKTSIVREAIRRYYLSGNRPNGREPMHAELIQIAQDVMDGEAGHFSRLEIMILQVCVAAALKAAADRENAFFARFGTKPELFNLEFGVQSEKPGRPPLKLQSSPDAAEIGVCGIIDRMDIDARGKAILINYTAEPAPDYGAMARGEAIDLPLYMIAAERLFNRTAGVGCTDSLVQRGRTRLVRTQHVAPTQFAPEPGLDDGASVRTLSREEYAALLETMIKAVDRIARRMMRADVAPTPGSHCRSCRYASVCRTTMDRGHSGGVPA